MKRNIFNRSVRAWWRRLGSPDVMTCSAEDPTAPCALLGPRGVAIKQLVDPAQRWAVWDRIEQGAFSEHEPHSIGAAARFVAEGGAA